MDQSRSSDETHSLVRELGLKEGIAIGLGTMVGAGIFVLSALAAERAGPASTMSYMIAGSICLLIALVISELATGMPKAGGSYTFIAEALGPLAGSIVGPGNWLGLTSPTRVRSSSYFMPILPFCRLHQIHLPPGSGSPSVPRRAAS